MASLLFLLFLCPFYVLRETSIRPIRGDAVKGLKRERKQKGNGKRIDKKFFSSFASFDSSTIGHEIRSEEAKKRSDIGSNRWARQGPFPY